MDPVQQLSCVQLGCPPQIALLDRLFELCDVAANDLGVQRNILADRQDRTLTQLLPDLIERFGKTVAGVLAVGFRPEQSKQVVAAHRSMTADGEHSHQRQAPPLSGATHDRTRWAFDSAAA
jgi:hypothetical protein